MKRSIFCLLALNLLAIMPVRAEETAAEEAVRLSEDEAAQYQASENLFKNYTAKSFSKLPAAAQQIDPKNVNLDLLSAAVFHETNQRRQEQQLQALEYLPTLRKAAAVQAEIMMQKGAIQHVNPGRPELRSPLDRFRALGLDPQYLAENVATIAGLDYESGRQVYVEMEDGTRNFARTPGGDPIDMRTYLGLANALLTDWMNSPPHRENILNEKARYLGCSCRQTEDGEGFHRFFCVQEFYAPLPEGLEGANVIRVQPSPSPNR